MNRELTALYPPHRNPPPGQREALEQELLGKWRSRAADRAGQPNRLRRVALGGLLLAGTAAASQLPIDTLLTVGQHVSIRLQPGASLPPPDALSEAFASAPEPAGTRTAARTQLRVTLDESGQPTIEADVWSSTSLADLESRLRAIPGLAKAEISLSPLQGPSRETLLGVLEQALLDVPPDPAAVAAARARLQSDLAARGIDGQVDLQVDEPAPGQKRVRVRTTRQPGTAP